MGFKRVFTLKLHYYVFDDMHVDTDYIALSNSIQPH